MECQCPQSGFLHFYGTRRKIYEEVLSVSMPSVELSSFLQPVMVIVITLSGMCQCPQSCFLHFYGYKKNQFGFIYYSVSMPSVVLSSFLPSREFGRKRSLGVSMPSVVLSSFLLDYRSLWRNCVIRCQCPQSCFLHFYSI